MTSITERTIFGQFEYWARAPRPGLLLDSSGMHVLVGCGTSYNLAMSLAASYCAGGLAAIAVPGHEWLRRPEAYLADWQGAQVIAISRSGELSETVAAARRSRQEGLEVIAITCDPASSIAAIADTAIVVETDPAEGIVMTTSASLMLLTGLRLGGVALDVEVAIVAAARLLERLDAIAGAVLAGRRHVVYLGGGALYGIAAEGGLKLQEMSQVATQTYHPLEYRHGPISLVDGESLTVMLYGPDTAADEMRLAAEIRALGGRVLGLGGDGNAALPLDGEASARSLALLPALQLLGERMAQLRSLDTTTPRHLTRVVQIAS